MASSTAGRTSTRKTTTKPRTRKPKAATMSSSSSPAVSMRPSFSASGLAFSHGGAGDGDELSSARPSSSAGSAVDELDEPLTDLGDEEDDDGDISMDGGSVAPSATGGPAPPLPTAVSSPGKSAAASSSTAAKPSAAVAVPTPATGAGGELAPFAALSAGVIPRKPTATTKKKPNEPGPGKHWRKGLKGAHTGSGAAYYNQEVTAGTMKNPSLIPAPPPGAPTRPFAVGPVPKISQAFLPPLPLHPTTAAPRKWRKQRTEIQTISGVIVPFRMWRGRDGISDFQASLPAVTAAVKGEGEPSVLAGAGGDGLAALALAGSDFDAASIAGGGTPPPPGAAGAAPKKKKPSAPKPKAPAKVAAAGGGDSPVPKPPAKKKKTSATTSAAAAGGAAASGSGAAAVPATGGATLTSAGGLSIKLTTSALPSYSSAAASGSAAPPAPAPAPALAPAGEETS